MAKALKNYFVPKTVQEACSMLSAHRGEARVIAGGTDLLRQIKCGEVLPEYVINVAAIPDQDYITYDKTSGLRIGAQATAGSIASSPPVREHFAVLASAAGRLGSPHIRRRATIAGNLCNASPSAELYPPLMVLGASLKIIRAGGERDVAVDRFAVAPGQTVLQPDEIVAEVRIPPAPARSAGAYLTQRVRKGEDIAMVSVAVLVTMDGDVMSDLKIALGAVAPTAIRAPAAEATLRGRKFSEDLLGKAGQAAAAEAQPIDDVRASAEYRRKMVAVLVARAVMQAMEQVKSG